MQYLKEKRISLTTLAREQNVNCATCWRWATRGAHGAKLETFTVGGRRYTTQEAFERFVAATNGQSAPPPPKAATNRQREAAIAAAEKELSRAGI